MDGVLKANALEPLKVDLGGGGRAYIYIHTYVHIYVYIDIGAISVHRVCRGVAIRGRGLLLMIEILHDLIHTYTYIYIYVYITRIPGVV